MVAAFNAATPFAPLLMHDFAANSLSDLLTPWEVIEKRLAAAAMADFVLTPYNPHSKTRRYLLARAREILIGHRSPVTPVALVRAAMRASEWTCRTTLPGIPMEEIDMQTTLPVGNSRTYRWGEWMITPRGCLDKYALQCTDCNSE